MLIKWSIFHLNLTEQYKTASDKRAQSNEMKEKNMFNTVCPFVALSRLFAHSIRMYYLFNVVAVRKNCTCFPYASLILSSTGIFV